MKSYTILAEVVTGVKGMQMYSGKSYPEHHFYQDHIAQLLAGGYIKDDSPEPAKKTSKDETKNQSNNN